MSQADFQSWKQKVDDQEKRVRAETEKLLEMHREHAPRKISDYKLNINWPPCLLATGAETTSPRMHRFNENRSLDFSKVFVVIVHVKSQMIAQSGRIFGRTPSFSHQPVNVRP